MAKKETPNMDALRAREGYRPNAVEEEEILPESEMGNEGPSDKQLKAVTDAARDQVRLKRLVAKLGEELDEAKKQLLMNQTLTLANAMVECSLESFKLAGGYEVEVDKIVKGSVPSPDNKKVKDAAAKHAAGIAYMDKMAPDLVTNTITINYPKGEEKLFKKFMRDLAQRKIPVDFKLMRSVNTQTLGKWIRTRLDNAQEVDEVVLNVHKVTIADVKIPKEADPLKA